MVSPLFESHFKNLPPTRARQLEILSNFGKQKERIEAEINMKGLLSKQDLMREVNRSTAWVDMKLAKYKLKPEEQLVGKNYYSKTALKILEKDLSEKQK